MKKMIPVSLMLIIFCLSLAFPASSYAGSNVRLRFYNASGELMQTYTVTKGDTFTIPWAANRKKGTFLGWSKTKNQTVDPDYTPDMVIRPESSMNFYMVLFPNSSVSSTYDEYSLLESLYTLPYDRVYMIGDSRFVHMAQHITAALGKSTLSSITFISKGRMGLSWFNNTAKSTLVKKIKQQDSTAPLAVVFNLGVNDLKHAKDSTINVKALARKYASSLKNLCKLLKGCNVTFYLVSVNPFNAKTSAIYKEKSYFTRSFRQLRQFNALLKKNLEGRYTYIDTYSYLMKNGYSTCRNGKDDGVHFCSETSLAIFAQILDAFPKTVSNY